MWISQEILMKIYSYKGDTECYLCELLLWIARLPLSLPCTHVLPPTPPLCPSFLKSLIWIIIIDYHPFNVHTIYSVLMGFRMVLVRDFISFDPTLTASTSPKQRPYGEGILLGYWILTFLASIMFHQNLYPLTQYLEIYSEWLNEKDFVHLSPIVPPFNKTIKDTY